MGQTSNKKRAFKRQECREALANHIYQKLNVSIPPEQVRLKPSPEHRYAWSVCQSKKHLLEVSLSNGTVGRYESIMEELGRSIEAVAPESLQNRLARYPNPTEEAQTPKTVSDSFTVTITQLRDANQELQDQLDKSHDDFGRLAREAEYWQAKYHEQCKESQQYQGLICQMRDEQSRMNTGILEAVQLLLSHRSCNSPD